MKQLVTGVGGGATQTQEGRDCRSGVSSPALVANKLDEASPEYLPTNLPECLLDWPRVSIFGEWSVLSPIPPNWNRDDEVGGYGTSARYQSVLGRLYKPITSLVPLQYVVQQCSGRRYRLRLPLPYENSIAPQTST